MLVINSPEGFQLAATVESHGWYRLAPLRWNAETAVLARLDEMDSGAVCMITITSAGRELHVSWSPKRASGHTEIERRVRRMLQLDLDLGSFHARCLRVRSHRDAVPAGFGRLLCSTSRFEDAVRVITTTNTAWSQTIRMNQLLVDHFGARDRRGRAAFPSARRLSDASPADLQSKCRLGYRASTISALARGVAAGALDLERDFGDTPTEELERFYRSLPGIGPYGAAHLLALDGRHDRIAVDTEFRRYVRAHHFRGREVSDSELCQVYDRWGRWRYLAYWWELWSEVREDV